MGEIIQPNNVNSQMSCLMNCILADHLERESSFAKLNPGGLVTSLAFKASRFYSVHPGATFVCAYKITRLEKEGQEELST